MIKRRITVLAMAAALLAVFAGGCASGEEVNIVSDTHIDVSQTQNSVEDAPSATDAEEDQLAKFGEHRYKIYDAEGLTWAEMRDMCASQGGYLATINSWSENEFLHNLCEKEGYKAVLFGYYLNEDTGKWEWVSGEDVYFVNWNPGEPNNSTGEEFYGMFYHGFDNGTWNDGDLNDIEAFICEWD